MTPPLRGSTIKFACSYHGPAELDRLVGGRGIILKCGCRWALYADGSGRQTPYEIEQRPDADTGTTIDVVKYNIPAERLRPTPPWLEQARDQ